MKLEDKLDKVLNESGLVETVEVSGTDKQLYVLCRVLQDRESAWLHKVDRVLTAGKDSRDGDSPWSEHICRRYFLKGDTLVWGWNFSLQSENLENAVTTISKIFVKDMTGFYPGKEENELDEIEILGAPRNRNAPRPGSSKGAFTTDDFKHPASKK